MFHTCKSVQTSYSLRAARSLRRLCVRSRPRLHHHSGRAIPPAVCGGVWRAPSRRCSWASGTAAHAGHATLKRLTFDETFMCAAPGVPMAHPAGGPYSVKWGARGGRVRPRGVRAVGVQPTDTRRWAAIGRSSVHKAPAPRRQRPRVPPGPLRLVSDDG
eukprot:CAMPEP_0174350082 /NCGR_PEP_ID=MMETSP0811_2-20130205/7060_1 /TAXON_ID=73025 ORGANISM="Eutreptiella gymnastica-like, Strain CCMP1594" /NCGR_SAMPLE_ID=MMETSP0811_2 /ASSEMBLY_ACC=CAM_ASM_000667 /LENGTH=158 /DNA_ID=CAMNT_0015478073 /DNA_START=525 /DNA_END=997 /DNA_ORIENTATION=-